MSRRETGEIDGVGRILPGNMRRPPLPRVVQHRQVMLRGILHHGIEQWIGRAARRGELDTDRAASAATLELLEGECRVVRVDGGPGPHPRRLRGLHRQHGVIPVNRVVRRLEVGRRRGPPPAQYRTDVPGDPDALAGGEPRGIQLAPAGAAGSFLVEMSVDIDQRSIARERCRPGRRHSSPAGALVMATSAELAQRSISTRVSSSSWASEA